MMIFVKLLYYIIGASAISLNLQNVTSLTTDMKVNIITIILAIAALIAVPIWCCQRGFCKKVEGLDAYINFYRLNSS